MIKGFKNVGDAQFWRICMTYAYICLIVIIIIIEMSKLIVFDWVDMSETTLLHSLCDRMKQTSIHIRSTSTTTDLKLTNK